MAKTVHVHIHDADEGDEKRTAAVLRRCSLDAKRLSADLEALARLVESGEEKIALVSATSFKSKLLSLNVPGA